MTNDKQNDQKIKDFVQDAFFDKQNRGLRVRQTLLSIFLWLILLVPLLVLINSVFPSHPLGDGFYHWDYAGGKTLSDQLFTALVYSVIFFFITSVLLLLRNNYRYKHLIRTRKTYNAKRSEQRIAAAEQLYNRRFGRQDFRENAKYYSVTPEQNLPTSWLRDALKDDKKEAKK